MPEFPYLTLEYLATAVILLDEESRIAYLNPAAENLFDVKRQKFARACDAASVYPHRATGQRDAAGSA